MDSDDAVIGANSRRNLCGRVADRIGARIVRGDLPPGTALPNEATLGAELGVSRTVLREAIKMLAAKGLVEVRPKTGTRIRPRGDWNVLDPEVLAWQFSGSEVPAYAADLLELRRIVEPAAAAMAAERARPEDLARIEHAFAEMERAGEDVDATIEPDLRFHLAILGATHNVFMNPFGALIQAAMRASFRLSKASPGAHGRSMPFHRAVLDAVRDRDPGRAAEAMRALLARARDDLDGVIDDGRRASPKARRPL